MTKRSKKMTPLEKQASSHLDKCNEITIDRMEAIRAMENLLKKKEEAKNFDEKMEFCTVVVSVAHRIIETDNQLRQAVQSANDFYENNPEACND